MPRTFHCRRFHLPVQPAPRQLYIHLFQLCNSSIVDCRCFHSEIHPAHCSPAGSPQFQLRNPSIIRGLPRTSASMACFHLAIQPTPRRLYSYLLQLCNSSIRGTTISPTSSPRPGASSRRTPPLPPLLSPPSHSGVGGWAMKARVNGVNGLENRGRQSGRKRRKTRNGGGYSSVQVGNEVNRIKTESKSKSNKKKRKPGVTWAQRRGR